MNPLTMLDASNCVRLITTLGHFLWQGAAVFALAAMLLHLLRRASSNARYLVAMAAFALMAACPPATWLLLSRPSPEPVAAEVAPPPVASDLTQAVPHPSPENATDLEQPAPPLAIRSTRSAGPKSPPPALAQPAPPRPIAPSSASVYHFDWKSYAPYAVSAYSAGCLAMLARLMLALYGGRHLRRQSQRLDDETILAAFAEQAAALGLRFTPAVACCRRVAVPTVFGLLRPMILLPFSATTGLTPDQLQMLLAHELSHIRRHDHLVNLLQRVVEALLFFHPAVWLLSRRIRVERELCCDDRVLSMAGQRFAYADSLLRMAELSLTSRTQPSNLASRWAAAGALAADGQRSSFHDRITRIVAGTETDGLRLRTSWALVFPLLILAVLAIARAVPAGSATVSKAGSDAAQGEYVLRGHVVDLQGRPVSDATVSMLSDVPPLSEAVTDANGVFALHHDHATLRYKTILASVDGGTRQGIVDFSNKVLDVSPAGPVEIVVKPSHSVTAEVVDAAGAPVPDASVQVFHAYKGASVARTDANGQTSFRVCPDFEVQYVVALKAGIGLDYFENYTTWPRPRSSGPVPLPDRVKLVLDGAQQVQVRAVDRSGTPLTGIRFVPWTILKPGKLSHVNLSGCLLSDETFAVCTDDEGIATFEWIPADVQQSITFLDQDRSRACVEQPAWQPGESGQRVTAVVLRNAHVSGKVFLPDGKPATNILLQAEGHNASPDYCRLQMRTRADGSYSGEIAAERSYVIAVLDDDWTATSLTGLFAREGEAYTGLDLKLTEGTLIRGTATIGPDNTPAAEETVTLIQVGEPLSPAAGQPGGSRNEKLVRWTAVDAKGEYKLRAGPGKYEMWGPGGGDKISFTVEEEEEFVRDFHSEAKPNIRLSGKVIAAQDGRPVGGATICAAPTNHSGRSFRSISNGQGVFEADRGSNEMVICACDGEGQRGGCALVSAEAAEVTIEVEPAARAVGRIVDEDGRGLPNHPVVYSFQMSIDGALAETVSSHDQMLTRGDGTFTIPAIPIGVGCRIFLARQDDGRTHWSEAHTFRAEKAGIIQLPDLEAETDSATSRPYSSASRPAATTRTSSEEDEERPFSLDLRVVHAATREPLDHVTLNVRVDDEERQATTDGNGRYRIILADSHPRYLRIRAKKPTFVPTETIWTRHDDPAGVPSSYTLQMEPGTTIGGTVRTEDGKPLEEVFVSVHPVQTTGRDRYDVSSYPVETDADGRWRVDGFPPGIGGVFVYLEHPMYPKNIISYQDSGDTVDQLRKRTHVATMQKAPVFSGRVLDEQGTPLADASVLVTDGTVSPDTLALLTTDANGQFEWTYHGPIQQQVHLVLIASSDRLAPERQTVAVNAPNRSIEFRLGQGRMVSGRVTDAQGSPVAGADVTLSQWIASRSFDGYTETDILGRFTFDHVRTDALKLKIHKAGHATKQVAVKAASAGERTELAITLPSTSTAAAPPEKTELHVEGRVVDAETREPVTRFQVIPGFYFDTWSNVAWEGSEAKTCADGRYEYGFNRCYDGIRFKIVADGYLPGVSVKYRGDEGEQVVDFTLKRGKGPTGVVRMPDGSPVAGALVALATTARMGGVRFQNARLTGYAPTTTTQTGPDGGFSFPPPSEDWSIVIVDERGYRELSAATLAANPVVTLEPWGRIEGTLLVDGKPAAGRKVTISYRWREVSSGFNLDLDRIDYWFDATTDENGRFHMDKLPRGEARILHRPDDSKPLLETFVPVSIMPGETVRVTLGAPKGRPVIGKAALSPAWSAPVDFKNVSGFLRSVPPPGYPPYDRDPKTYNKARDAFYRTEAGRQYLRYEHQERVEVAADGTFRIADVAPGRYEFDVNLMAADDPGKRIGTGTVSFEMPSIAGGNNAVPLDVGTVNVAPSKPNTP